MHMPIKQDLLLFFFQKFRSIDEIKEMFAKQNVTLSSEMELVTKLYTELLEGGEVGTLLAVLEDLEFYIHKYDNAVYFVDLGGVSTLTHLLNTSSDAGILANTALCLGSAAQRYVGVVQLQFF